MTAAETCECGRPARRGKYGYLETTCGSAECAGTDDTPRLRKRRRLSPFSEKTLERGDDFRSGLPGGFR